MRDYLGVFFIIIICFSCRSSKNEPESTQDFLKNKFGYLLDTALCSIDSKSYINDSLNMSIISLVILNSKKKISNSDLTKAGFQEFHENLDTSRENRHNNKIKLRFPEQKTEKRLAATTILQMPIDTSLAKNFLMKKIKVHPGEDKLAFYDTVLNQLYFYRYNFYKPSVF